MSKIEHLHVESNYLYIYINLSIIRVFVISVPLWRFSP